MTLAKPKQALSTRFSIVTKGENKKCNSSIFIVGDSIAAPVSNTVEQVAFTSQRLAPTRDQEPIGRLPRSITATARSPDSAVATFGVQNLATLPQKRKPRPRVRRSKGTSAASIHAIEAGSKKLTCADRGWKLMGGKRPWNLVELRCVRVLELRLVRPPGGWRGTRGVGNELEKWRR